MIVVGIGGEGVRVDRYQVIVHKFVYGERIFGDDKVEEGEK